MAKYFFLCNLAILITSFVFSTSISTEELSKLQKSVDFTEVKQDLISLFTDSKDWWPADFGHYGPFFIRLAWHCAGSYRASDGRGGCDGGRQRFDPERSWDDNTNLDKARKLLWPIKEKYGLGLSWGDLFILSGTTAIESMGGPVLGFCGGRVDDEDAEDSLLLGPTKEQDELMHCIKNGECKSPLGATTLGLIYVNPEGPMGNPDPDGSRHDVRDTFRRMNMNDTETVALIGGGHAFGKAHGACPLGPGKKPSEDPVNPWKGNCGDGKGKNTFTSGFEGSWTTTPITFGNQFFQNLLNYEYEAHKGPGGSYQWEIKSEKNRLETERLLQKREEFKKPVGPPAHGEDPTKLMMLTSDMSLTKDPEYLKLVKTFANDLEYFADQFSHAWYKMVTRDMGPVTRCIGNLVAPPQPFQNPLPPPPEHQPNWENVRLDIYDALFNQSEVLKPDSFDNRVDYSGWVVRLAYQCASSFRKTDYIGGCNGARIRFEPEKSWSQNKDLEKVLSLIEPIQKKYSNELTWADLIVFAGTVALEHSSNFTYSYDFCPGRSDATQGIGEDFKEGLKYNNRLSAFEDRRKIMGFTKREYVALQGRIRSLESQRALGYIGTWWTNGRFDNSYFRLLLNETWEKVSETEVKSISSEVYMTADDLVILYDASLQGIAQDYASDNDLFMREFRAAWTKLMNSDRFDGPLRNICSK